MRRTVVGLWCWLVQPAYVIVEVLVAAAASATYSLRDDTISALGMLTCAPGHGGGGVDVCSPGHGVLDAAFVVFGVLRAVGAVLVLPRAAAGRWCTVAIGLWVASALSAAAVGLAPVDQQPGWHVVAALPVFVLQPLAVLATAEALRRAGAWSRGVVTSGFAVGALTLAAAAAFGLRLDAQTWVGGLERLALWPAYLWLAVVAATVLGTARSRGAGRRERAATVQGTRRAPTTTD